MFPEQTPPPLPQAKPPPDPSTLPASTLDRGLLHAALSIRGGDRVAIDWGVALRFVTLTPLQARLLASELVRRAELIEKAHQASRAARIAGEAPESD